MRNVIILGSGRSGTSMVAGLFRNSGASLGDHLWPPTISNPQGYYEDRTINQLNDEIIRRMLRWPWLNRIRVRFEPAIHVDERCLWLAAPRRLRRPHLPRELLDTMKRCTSRLPFCYKDPRFGRTLPMWRPLLPDDTCFIVVFREPSRTVDSMLRDAHEGYDPPLPISSKWAYVSWYRMYCRVLHDLSHDGDWLFVHYDQVLNRQAIAPLSRFSEAKLDTDQLSNSQSRSREVPHVAGTSLLRRCSRLYDALHHRAAEDIERWQPSGCSGS